jgi:predicted TPR repeat methyltransferase
VSEEAASADLQAAAYWRNVARSDRSEINVAATKIRELTAAAQREEKEPNEAPRRTRGLSTG